MLGFSPLASAPPGDDGVVAKVVYLLNAVPITTGQPALGASSSLSQIHEIGLVGITTVGPVVEPSICSILFINGSVGRKVQVSDRSNNIASISASVNFCVVSANTPNKVIVEEANEAA